MSDQKNIIIKRARELRKGMTPAERTVWEVVRNRRFMNLKFLRQHPIVHNLINGQLYFFIADFYCAEKKLIIEVDGAIHENTIEYDQMRETILKEYGKKVFRIKNEDTKNPERLVELLTEAVQIT